MDGRPQKVAKKKKLRGSSSLPGLDKPAATRQNLSDGFGGSSVVQLSVKPKRNRSQGTHDATQHLDAEGDASS